MRVTRRRLLALLGTAAAAAVVGVGFYEAFRPKKRVLRVYNNSEYIDRDMIDH